jgi:CBS-domain-containing membrane protein
MIKEVVSISPGESVEDAARIMAEHCISSLIVASDGVLHGILTEKDILTRVVAKGMKPAEARVVDIMSPSLITIGPETSLEEANKFMVEKRIKKLPVVESGGHRLLGILSITDFARLQPKLIEDAKKRAANWHEDNVDFFKDLLKMDEGQHLEFKSTLRYDLMKKCVNPELEQVCLKTISAFMNADGGDLVIGVTDDKSALGLSQDYQTLKVQNRDGFENKLISLISAKIGDSFLRFVKVSFMILDGVEICRVRVLPASEPVFLRDNGQETFFVRTGNNSRPFSLSDTTRYVIERWR